MKRKILTLAVFMTAVISISGHNDNKTLMSGSTSAPFYIIKNEKPASIILYGNKSREYLLAANELRSYLQKSTGVKLQVMPVEKISTIKKGLNRLIVGDCKYARENGIDPKKLKTEEYIVKIKGADMFFIGNSRPAPQKSVVEGNKLPSLATRWAVDEFLDRVVGVRWLWPGKSGEYVPKMKTVAVPANLDWKKQPPLKQRVFIALPKWYKKDMPKQKKLNEWLSRQQQGARMKSWSRHAYTSWYRKYYKNNTHRDLFAKPPEGYIHPHAKHQGYMKLCISNPAVMQTILKEWREQGSPDGWSIAPNDGVGWCVCENCRKQDPPEFANVPDKLIHSGKAKINLAPRYYKFWGELCKKMEKENPDIKLFTYSYGTYRHPTKELTIGPHLVISMVPGLTPEYYDLWQEWSSTGADLILRPNWFHTLALAPNLQLKKVYDFYQMARAKNMIGYSFDTMIGSWGVQGPLYYMLARLSYRPDMSLEEIKNEYANAFGKAAPKILEYLNYWDKYSDKLSTPYCVGGASEEKGLYTKLSEKYKFPYHPLAGSYRGMPYLYPDKIIDPAMKILEQAEKLAVRDTQALEKVHFLMDGLKFMKITRDCIAASNPKLRPKGMTVEQNKKLYAEMQKMADDLTKRNVIYGNLLEWRYKTIGLRLNPDKYLESQKTPDLSGR